MDHWPYKQDLLQCTVNCLSRQASRLHAERDIGKLRVIQSDESIAKKYVMSVAAACIAETVTYPLDLTKTRL